MKPASKRAQKTPPAAKAKTKANAKGKAKTTKKRDTARGAGAKKVEKAQPKKSPGKKKNIPETKEADREEGKQQAEPEDLLKKKLHSVPWHLEHFFTYPSSSCLLVSHCGISLFFGSCYEPKVYSSAWCKARSLGQKGEDRKIYAQKVRDELLGFKSNGL